LQIQTEVVFGANIQVGNKIYPPNARVPYEVTDIFEVSGDHPTRKLSGDGFQWTVSDESLVKREVQA
jgi:hypothetical protein